MNIPCKTCPIGGGELPVGYIKADFLETTGSQRLVIPTLVDDNFGLHYDYTALQYKQNCFDLDNQVAGDTGWRSYRITQTGVRWYIKNWDPGAAEKVRTVWECNFLNNRKLIRRLHATGIFAETNLPTRTLIPLNNFVFGCGCLHDNGVVTQYFYYTYIRFHSIIMSYLSSIVHQLIPSLDDRGVPCMYDKITKQPFYNKGSGAFIVGLTKAQAKRLSSLPPKATTTTLRISLPASILDSSNNVIDTEVKAAMDKAKANGWKFSITSYTS